jgi:hypothetical protein
MKKGLQEVFKERVVELQRRTCKLSSSLDYKVENQPKRVIKGLLFG